MAEVIATFAALSSVLQVVEFSAKVTKHAIKLVASETNALAGNLEIERLAREYQSLSASPIATNATPNTHDQAVAHAREQCQEEANNLLRQLEALKLSPAVTGTKRLKEGTQKALKAVTERKKIEKKTATFARAQWSACNSFAAVTTS